MASNFNFFPTIWDICQKTLSKDNGNSLFDDSTPVLELSSIISVKDWTIDEILCKSDRFVDTVLTYISGFLMKSIISKEKCTLCYTYLTESKNRMTCPLIDSKQLGGLIYPLADVVSVVTLANRCANMFLFY